MNVAVQAAGAVLWRRNSHKEIEVLLVHRPRYDDWSLPKGKLESHEELITCAYREAMEETGFDLVFGPFISEIEYFVEEGLKRVSYWAARVTNPDRPFTSNSEVDEITWLTIEEAIQKVSRESDREVIEAFIKIPYDSSPLIFLRHAKALAREQWNGDDEDRPLDILGQKQAKRMLSLYQVFGLKEIHTSDALRCHDTVYEMARALDIDLRVTTEVSEYTWKKPKGKERAKEYVKELIKINEPIILCSHNPVLPRMLEKLTKKIDFDRPENKLKPGESWILHHDKKKVLQIDHLAAPLAPREEGI